VAFERLGKRHDPREAEREYETSIGFGNVSRELADAIRRLGDATAVRGNRSAGALEGQR
jgi:hypothetical protein